MVVGCSTSCAMLLQSYILFTPWHTGNPLFLLYSQTRVSLYGSSNVSGGHRYRPPSLRLTWTSRVDYQSAVAVDKPGCPVPWRNSYRLNWTPNSNYLVQNYITSSLQEDEQSKPTTRRSNVTFSASHLLSTSTPSPVSTCPEPSTSTAVRFSSNPIDILDKPNARHTLTL